MSDSRLYSEQEKKAQEEYYVREGIYNLKFSHVSKHLEKFKAGVTFLDKVKWIVAAILAAKYFIDFATDFWVAIKLFTSDQVGLGAAYVVFVILSIGFMLYSVREAYYIVQSDDISDALTNNDAKRWYTFNFGYWLMFRQIGNALKTWDKVAFFIYLTLKEWYILILVAVPQLVIVIVKYTNACDSASESAVTATPAPCPVSLCTGGPSEPACCTGSLPPLTEPAACDPDYAMIVKIVVLGIQLWILGAAISLYPLMRCCGMLATSGTAINFRAYCTLLADRVISTVLTKFIRENDPALMDQLEEEMKQKKQNLHSQSPSGKLENKVSSLLNGLSITTPWSPKGEAPSSPTSSSPPASPTASPTSPTATTPDSTAQQFNVSLTIASGGSGGSDGVSGGSGGSDGSDGGSGGGDVTDPSAPMLQSPV